MDLANKVFEAMCGHGALAAALGIPVMDAMQYFEKGGWINMPMMKAAIYKAGKNPIKVRGMHRCGPGVALIQFLGKWMNEGVPAAARCAHRHWVAFQSDKTIWDSNIEMWVSFEEWEAWLPTLYTENTTGHEFATIWSIE